MLFQTLCLLILKSGGILQFRGAPIASAPTAINLPGLRRRLPATRHCNGAAAPPLQSQATGCLPNRRRQAAPTASPRHPLNLPPPPVVPTAPPALLRVPAIESPDSPPTRTSAAAARGRRRIGVRTHLAATSVASAIPGFTVACVTRGMRASPPPPPPFDRKGHVTQVKKIVEL